MNLKRWYLNVDQPRSKLLAIRGMAIQEPMPAIVVDRPPPGDFLLMHFHTAAAVKRDSECHEIAPHSVYIWPTDARQCFGNSSHPWLHSWIHFDGSRARTALDSAGVALERPLKLDDARLTEKYLRLLYDEMSSNVEPDALILEGFLSVWMRELARATQGSPSSRRIPSRLVAVRQFIDHDPSREVALSMLAGKAALSVTQFSAEFRRYFGTSPMNYVIRVRMHRALHLLSDRALSIKEIAARCGFSDAFYFSKQFRKHFGKSPREYRSAAAKRL